MSDTDNLKLDIPAGGEATLVTPEASGPPSTPTSPTAGMTQHLSGTGPKSAGFEPGNHIGPYRLENKLGEGGMGVVFKAVHTKLDKTVAIKILPSQFLSQKSALARFEREMKAVGRLQHVNVVQAFDAGEMDGTHFLVMEYVEGTDLQRLVATRGVMTLENACKAISQSAQGLAAAHEMGLVHRDIKPSNLFVTHDGQIKILDLGLARMAQHDDEEGQLTHTGQVFGTPEYMAPEQWEDVHACDGRADLYSLGCSLFFLLTGRPPYGGDEYKTAPRKMLGHINDPIPDLPALRSDVPPALNCVYRKMMAKKAADRFATAAEVVEALSPWVTGKTSKLDGSQFHSGNRGTPHDVNAPTMVEPLPEEDQTSRLLTQADPITPRNNRWLWPTIGGALVALLVTGALLYPLLTGSPRTPDDPSTTAQQTTSTTDPQPPPTDPKVAQINPQQPEEPKSPPGDPVADNPVEPAVEPEPAPVKLLVGPIMTTDPVVPDEPAMPDPEPNPPIVIALIPDLPPKTIPVKPTQPPSDPDDPPLVAIIMPEPAKPLEPTEPERLKAPFD